MNGHILVVEDDEDIREIVSLYLSKQGFEVTAAASIAEAMIICRNATPDLLLADILLPDSTGTELTRWVRKRSDMPIILMSCKKEADDIVEGLELGADDYITKPFEPSVVVARVKALLRRTRTKDTWEDGRLRIDPVGCVVTIDNQPVSLFAKELQLLLFMASHHNQVYSVEQLYEHIWGWDKEGDLRTVMVHISNLRKKIEADPANPSYIVTVRGFGYKFCWNAVDRTMSS
ncbi:MULTISPECIES: response regulator transcription factor [Cohnella]|uniref:response regulator transcription factor n=1 Tax=Cohnella TaxID=329857 RepID=UPI0009BB5149|nr:MULTISPECIES: response regulator transcription factor [Cohnella]MBN2981893.1 response regulator transcription factor [Cohnella algarum]